MSTLVVFYSRRGIARRIANDYHSYKNADVIDLRVKRNYQGSFGYLKSRSDSIKKYLPELEDYDTNLDKYDKVIIIGSIWSNSICNPILSFLSQNKGKLKNIEYILINKNKLRDLSSLLQELDYTSNVHFKRASVITVRFNRITNVKRY